jgi:outer membrane protein assembly factor BamB
MKKYLSLIFLAFALIVDVYGGDWPQWRGPNRDDVSKETGLLKEWPKEGPKRLWLYDKAGNGYSGPAIVSNVLYTLGTRDESEILLALDANTGAELWTSTISGVFQNDRGEGGRGTPAVDGANLYSLSGGGTLACVSGSDKKIVWKKSMSDLGGKIPHWGYSESVLVDGDKVLCTPGGSKGAIAAFDKRNGNVIWQSAEFTDTAHYASIVSANINGTHQYVQLTMRHLVGIDANSGKVLWKTEFPGSTAVIPTPIVRDNYVYATAGYGAGCKLVKIGSDNAVSVVYENKVMKNHHGGVILLGNYVYGHSDGGGWVCQEFLSGKEVWSEKPALGKGPAGSAAENMLYCLDERSGIVALIEASPKGWSEHGRFKLEPQTKIRSSSGAIWTHPVVSNGKLYLRDQDLIYCYDIKAK